LYFASGPSRQEEFDEKRGDSERDMLQVEREKMRGQQQEIK